LFFYNMLNLEWFVIYPHDYEHELSYIAELLSGFGWI